MAPRGPLMLLLAPALAWAASSVQLRDNEIWLLRDNLEQQLTHDGKAKGPPLLSPGGRRIAYYEQCPVNEGCTPAVVILDLAGGRLQSFPVRLADAPCMSILRVAWSGDDAVAAECHLNPSLSEYVEIELATGRTRRDLLGFWFTPSPDARFVAHVGWIVHFAPPYAQSYYLQLDRTTVYPHPSGPPQQPPQVVRKVGPTYTGNSRIHAAAGLGAGFPAHRLHRLHLQLDPGHSGGLERRRR